MAHPRSSWRRRSRSRGSSGFDSHERVDRRGERRARQAGVADRCRFEVAGAKDFPGADTTSSASSTPCTTWAIRSARRATCARRSPPDGTWLIVEPYADDRVEDNLNPVGRAYYAASTLICTPCSLSQEVGLALGAQAGEARLREVAQGAGFSKFRRAVQTPFNLVFEARA